MIVTGTHTRFSHDAHCPEISPVDCADPDFEIEPHEHHQGMTLTRLKSALSVGLGGGWQAAANVPFDLKFLTIDYTDPQGNPYNPPYGNIHHRNETLAGLGDGTLEIQKFWNAGTGWVIGGGLGSTLPLGRTEEDPYALTEKSLKHQHVQMGSGTFDPVMSATAVWMGHKWGALGVVNGRAPLYENAKGFRPAPSLQVLIGPTYRFTGKLMMTSDIAVLQEWQELWNGSPNQLSGRTAIMADLALIYRFSPVVAAMGQARTTIAQWSVEALIIQRFVGSFGVSITPKKKESK